jgi:hypothetical protein
LKAAFGNIGGDDGEACGNVFSEFDGIDVDGQFIDSKRA